MSLTDIYSDLPLRSARRVGSVYTVGGSFLAYASDISISFTFTTTPWYKDEKYREMSSIERQKAVAEEFSVD